MQTNVINNIEQVTAALLIPKFSVQADTVMQDVATLARKMQKLVSTLEEAQARYSASGQKLRCDTRSAVGSASALSSSQYSNLTWHHAGAVFASDSSRICYLDGVAGIEDTTNRTPANLDTTAIGALCRSSVTWYMSGRIAEIGIWKAALTADEMSALAAGYAPPLAVDLLCW